MSSAAEFVFGGGLNDLGTGPISNAPYVSEEYFEREKQIWRRSWVAVGREADIAHKGDYLTFDLGIVHASIVVVRGEDKKLRAFHNVCSHRAGRIVCNKEQHGRTRFLTCPFHGWAFSLDGKLLSVPKKEIFKDLPAKEALGLKEISVDVWGGFVFVNLAPNPQESLRQYLRGLPQGLEAYLGEKSWRWYTGYRRTFRANWKDLMNIQHEGYHASFLHGETLAVDFAPADCANTVFPDSNGAVSLLTVSRPQFHGDPLAKMTAVQKLSMEYGRTSNWVENDTSVASDSFPGAVNHRNSDRWVFDCYTIFPNLLLFVGTAVLSVMRTWPISAHEAVWEWDWFFDHEVSNFGELFNREHGRIATRNALAEDWGVIELIHENMRAGVFNGTNIAQDMEATVRAFYEKLIRRVPVDQAGAAS